MAGLTAARRLVELGRVVKIVDKGRGVGGRLATRRAGAATFDHGAQFITARSAEFRRAVADWHDRGVVAHWADGFPRGIGDSGAPASATPPAAAPSAAAPSAGVDGHPRYRGVPGMTAVAKDLAEGLDVDLSTRVAAVRRVDDNVELETAEGETLSAQSVVLTPPVPQTIALLREGGLDSLVPEEAAALTYHPCLVLLAVDGEVELPEPGGLQRPSETIDWIADNARKGVSGAAGAITVHCAPEISAAYHDAPDEEAAEVVLREVRRIVKLDPQTCQVKRWRYSKPQRPLDVGAVSLEAASQIVLAGDAFRGARVEGAFLSGLAAAERVTAVLKRSNR